MSKKVKTILEWCPKKSITEKDASKVKALVGPEPHYREILGAIALMSVRQITYRQAEDLGILDPTRLMSDTTAQEAMIPYPNEVGLMKRFTDLTVGALKKVGGKFSNLKGRAQEIASKVKDLSLTNQYLWGTWLPQSGYELAPALDLEIYPAAFRPDDHDSEMELWIPLVSAPQVVGQ